MRHPYSLSFINHCIILTVITGTSIASPYHGYEGKLSRLVAKGNELMQLSRETLDTSLYHEAEHAYEAALAENPRSVDAILGLAWVANSEHAFEDGERWARKALEIDPECSEAYSLLGDAFVEKGLYDLAFDHYQKAIDIKPNLSTYSRAAHLLWLTGQTIRGENLMRLAISTGGSRGEHTGWCRAQLGIMQYCSGNLQDALRTVEKAMEDSPSNPQILATLGMLKLANGERTSALNCFEKSARQSPNHIALSHLYDLYLESGRYADADRIYTALIEFHSSHQGHQHNSHTIASTELALFWAEREMRLPTALHMAQQAYNDFPNIGSAHALAWAHYKNGEVEKAVHWIGQALTWDPPYPKIYIHAARIYESLGDTAKASALLERSVAAIDSTVIGNALVPKSQLAYLSVSESKTRSQNIAKPIFHSQPNFSKESSESKSLTTPQ